MKKKTIVTRMPSTAVCYETLEPFARLEIQHWLQHLLEAEVTEFRARGRPRTRCLIRLPQRLR